MLSSLFGNVGWLFLVLAAVWMLQLWLSLGQSRRFHRHVMRLKKDGDRTSVGVAGNSWSRRVYAVLVVDEERNVVHARSLSGFTVFATPEPVPALEGLPLSRFSEEEPAAGMKPKMWEAFRNAASFIRKADEAGGEAESDSIVVEQASSMPSGYSVDQRKERKEGVQE